MADLRSSNNLVMAMLVVENKGFSNTEHHVLPFMVCCVLLNIVVVVL